MTPTAVCLLVAGSCALMLVVDTLRARQERRDRRLDDAYDELLAFVAARIAADRAEAIERMAQQLTREGAAILDRERTT
jgi:recombinational DNA repair ATPase RecF